MLAPLADGADAILTYRVLIAHLDQLHNFVQRIPPLAWELLEYASEPLEIVYPERKPTPMYPDQPQSICVRLVKQPLLLRFIQKEGPQWAVRPATTAAVDLLPDKKIDCFSRKYPYQRVKAVAIATDGTFSFLR